MKSAASELPEAFLERLDDILVADDRDRYLEMVATTRPLTVRGTAPGQSVETLAEELAASGLTSQLVPWMPEALILSPPDRRILQSTSAHDEGRLFIQSLSSMAVVEALDVRPGQDVLDCCAAPGGKTSLIRRRQDGKGILIANDLSRRRLMKMKQVLKQLGVSGVEMQSQPAETLGGSCASCFDRVLLDAPCSGEGRFRSSSPSTWQDWDPGKITRLARLQKRLLKSALHTLRPGGELVYATCTLAPEENELVLADVLANPPVKVEVIPISLDLPGRRPGLSQWNGKTLPEWTSMSIRIVPEESMSPFFLTRFRRN